MNQFVKSMAVVAGFVVLCAAEGLTGVQSTQPRRVPHPSTSSRGVQPTKQTPPDDDFAGLKFTGEQQAKIDKIHQDIKSRMELVQKTDKLRPEQKSGMLDGYRRIERAQMFEVLTPEQQAEVRKKARARRAAALEEQKKQSQQK